LVEKEKMKDDFIKLASHELKTPIQPILGYSSLGMRGMVKDHTAWTIVHKEAQRLMKLANNIVDITMIQSGLMKYEMTKIRVTGIVQSSVDEIREIAQERRLAVELFIDDACNQVEILADGPRLKHVFDEILENALKVTTSGAISVGSKVVNESEELAIGFRDSGTPIEPEMLPHIFDIFSSKSSIDAAT
jgi:signal transduction histidine kinase